MLLKEVNELWTKIYPYLAAQVMEYFGRSYGDVLELGPFASGISVETARVHSGLHVTITAQDPGVVDYLRKEIQGAGFGRRTGFACSELDNLGFADSVFDLVIFRGAYFFLDQEGRIIQEIYRVLRQDGLAFIGGGYGKNTPQAFIDEIADRSRDLNDRLGRKRVTVGELEDMVNASGLSGHARIEMEGGLWLLIKK